MQAMVGAVAARKAKAKAAAACPAAAAAFPAPSTEQASLGILYSLSILDFPISTSPRSTPRRLDLRVMLPWSRSRPIRPPCGTQIVLVSHTLKCI